MPRFQVHYLRDPSSTEWPGAWSLVGEFEALNEEDAVRAVHGQAGTYRVQPLAGPHILMRQLPGPPEGEAEIESIDAV